MWQSIHTRSANCRAKACARLIDRRLRLSCPVMIAPATAILGLMTLTASASGRAGLSWIGSSMTCEPGKTVQTAIRMEHDKGWHSYWKNPGEGGVKTTIEWQLPAGWKVGDFLHPVPVRFKTGDLTNFGYEGTILFPVTLTAPSDFTGNAKLTGKITWLACNDDACVPGEAEVSLDLTEGPAVPSKSADAIHDSLKRIPQILEGASLEVIAESGALRLKVNPENHMDLSRFDIFPATPGLIDPTAEIKFRKNGTSWVASAPLDGYAKLPVTELCLVFSSTDRCFSLAWKAR
jgi:DsbC/DsbD-like thiol-disulfide interchange protein